MSEPDKKIVEVPQDEKTTVEIIPFGTDERIKLNIRIVQQMIAVPTKSGKTPDFNECMKFIMLCKARHLNPFEGDAFLLGYDTQSGPKFSLITAHQVFLKRAEASEGFDGMESGVILKTANGIEEREGDLTLEGEELLGGWAKVYRKEMGRPFYRRLKLSTFSTGQSRWQKDAAGMIVKCAEADALRSAFPTHLGGLYVSEEQQPIDVTATNVPIDRPRITAPAFREPIGLEGQPGQSGPEKPKRGRKPKEPAAPTTPDQPAVSEEATEIEKRLQAAGYSKIDLLVVAIKRKFIDAPQGFSGDEKDLADVPLASVGQEKLATFLDNWDKLCEIIDEDRAKPAPEPSDALFK